MLSTYNGRSVIVVSKLTPFCMDYATKKQHVTLTFYIQRYTADDYAIDTSLQSLMNQWISIYRNIILQKTSLSNNVNNTVTISSQSIYISVVVINKIMLFCVNLCSSVPQRYKTHCKGFSCHSKYNTGLFIIFLILYFYPKLWTISTLYWAILLIFMVLKATQIFFIICAGSSSH